MSNLPEPHATNAMCAEFDGWTHVHLSIDGDVVWGLPPGPGKFQITVPNFPEDALACASLLPKLMPKIKARIDAAQTAQTPLPLSLKDDILLWESLENPICRGNHPAFCALVIEAVRKVSEEAK